MTANEYDSPQAYPVAPPTEAGELGVPPRPSSWPTAIGVIAIVLGAGGALLGVWGLVASRFMGFFPAPAGLAPDFAQGWAAWTVPVSILGMGVAILLLVAGIGLVRRRAWAVKTCLVWAVLKMLSVVLGSVSGYVVQRAMFDEIQQGPSVPGMSSGVVVGFAAVGLCLGLVWGWALPIFLLIWFSRGKIKAEVAGWT